MAAPSMFVDYQDHYSYADSSISVYNFLQYEAREWVRWSPSLQFQNRLRHADYLAMYQDAGFDIVQDEPTAGSAEDVRLVGALPLASRFQTADELGLATRNSLVTLKVDDRSRGPRPQVV